LWNWCFELRASCLQSSVLPLKPYLQSILLWLFWRWVSETICWSWPQTAILLISASQVVVRISHQSPERSWIFVCLFVWWYWGLNSGPHTC
jgi:hypothetical protein